MPKLHLVAITPDSRGLVLSEGAESSRGDLVLDIDDRLLEAIDRAQRQRARDEGAKLSSAALPSRREPGGEDGERPTPRQIQDRLRAGESVASIAESSGVDEDWVERFAQPVLSELEMIVDRARELTLGKARVGVSKLPLGASVAANLVERGIEVSADDIEDGWSAHQRADSTWLVVFSFPHKGRRQKAEWSVDLGSGVLVARNKLAMELGYRDSGRKPTRPAAAKAAAATTPAAPPVAEPIAVTEAEDGRQVLPGTGPEIELVLDSIGMAPGDPARANETDPTIEFSVPSRPAPPPSSL